MRKLIVFLKYGSKIEVNVNTPSEAMQLIRKYKDDGLSVTGYDLQAG